MSCGVCPIVSNVTGINNIISNKKNGLIFELNEIKKIKEILFKINKGEIKEIQKNARKYILNSHDIFLIMNREAKFLK